MYCMRGRTDFTHLFGMWKLLSQPLYRHGAQTDKSKFNLFGFFFFFLAGLY